MKVIKNWLQNRKRRNQIVYSQNRFNDTDHDLERAELLYGDFHYECGDRD